MFTLHEFKKTICGEKVKYGKKIIIGLLVLSQIGFSSYSFAEAEGADADKINPNYDTAAASDNSKTEDNPNAAKSDTREAGVDIEIDIKEMINRSKEFSVSDNLSVGNESSLKITNEDDDKNLLYKIISLLTKTIGALAILLYVVAGFFVITSQGDENQLQKGKTIVTYTSLGLVVAFASYLLVTVIMSATFNIGT